MGASESKGREENGENVESSDTALAKESSTSALTKGEIAGAAILALGVGVVTLVSLMGDSSKSHEEDTMGDPVDEQKTMIAPGKGGVRMPRDDFEEDPCSYFRKLRDDDRKKKSLANK